MYDELDRLLKLTKIYESETIESKEETDLPATIFTYDEKGNPEGALTTKHDSDYSDENDSDSDENTGDAKPKSVKKSDEPTEDQDDADMSVDDSGTPGGSSGNATVKNGGKKSPLFEPDGDPDLDEAEIDAESLGMPSLRKGMKVSLTDAIELGMGREFARKVKFEAANPLFVSNAPFKLGDVVCAENNPMLFVVKNNDGQMITAAKPTAHTAEHSHCKDGCWPEFTFAQDEIKPMDNATMNDLGNIVAFNDRFRGFDGTIEDRAPMDRAQDFARQQTIEDISQNLDEILGQYRFAAQGGDKEFSYTECSPKVMFRRPDGSFTSEQQMGGYQIKWGD